MTAADDITRAKQGYAAFAACDMTALAELMAPDVEWVCGGENVLTGVYRGRDEVFRFFGRLLALTDGTFTIEPRTLAEPEPGLVLALVRLSATGPDGDYEEVAVQLLDVRDGLVRRCRTYTENSLLFDRLVGPQVITMPDLARQQEQLPARTG